MQTARKITEMLALDRAPRLRKIVIGVIGGTILLVGLVLILLPGPALLVILFGLVILASEFAWARRLLRRGRSAVDKARRWKWRDLLWPTRDA
jgi:tellurite resistance protein TerC